MLSHADAQDAMNEVIAKYSAHLPTEVLAAVKDRPATGVFQFYADTEYAAVFDYVYDTTFKAANAVLFGSNVITAAQCPGFCTPQKDIKRRMIFMAHGRGTTKGTYYHEFIHFLQHTDFYPKYYVTGGMAPFQVEGFTEYLTRNVSTAVAQERSRQGKYQANFLKTQAWVNSNKQNYAKLLAYNFKGVAADISAIKK